MSGGLRFGVVGCGAVTLKAHLPVLLRSPRARLTALVDSDPEWARELAGRVGCPWSGADYRKLEGRVDAVVVATPAATHARIVRDLLELGVHVLCEKPAATTSRDVARMFAAARVADRLLLIGQNTRFIPPVAFLHRLCDTGLLGRDGHLEGSLGGKIERWPARTDYRDKPELAGGGALIDQGIHLVDLAVWLFGGAPRVLSYEPSGGAAGLELDAEVELEFTSGGTARLAASHSRGLSPEVRYTAPGGWVRFKLIASELSFYLEGARACRLDGLQQPVLEPSGTLPLFSRQLHHFCDAIERGRPLVVTQSEAVAVLETIERCYGADRGGGEASP